jgi:hypothetical protein
MLLSIYLLLVALVFFISYIDFSFLGKVNYVLSFVLNNLIYLIIFLTLIQSLVIYKWLTEFANKLSYKIFMISSFIGSGVFSVAMFIFYKFNHLELVSLVYSVILSEITIMFFLYFKNHKTN